jgi:hypothetical protein
VQAKCRWWYEASCVGSIWFRAYGSECQKSLMVGKYENAYQKLERFSMPKQASVLPRTDSMGEAEVGL